jgi:hypothetical protein
VGVVIHTRLGAIANLVAFVFVASAYGAFTTRLERRQAVAQAQAPEKAPTPVSVVRSLPTASARERRRVG